MQLSFAEQIARCQTQTDISNACAMIAQKYGFTYYSILRLPAEGETRLHDISLDSNWPETFVRRYDEMRLLERTPLFELLRESAAPLAWSISNFSVHVGGRKDRAIVELFQSHNMTGGIYFNVHSASGQHGAVSFSGDRCIPAEEEVMELNYHSALLFDRSCAIAGSQGSDSPDLSRRERECILWTSHGKTSYEIGVILGLSEHTINNYLTNVCRKIGAVNRAHLVGLAMRKGILQ